MKNSLKNKGVSMNLSITFTNFEHTRGLDEIIKRKTKRLAKLLGKNADIQWIGSVDKNQHSIGLKILSEEKGDFFVKVSEKNLYQTIDTAVQKMKVLLIDSKHRARLHFKRREVMYARETINKEAP